MAKTYRKGAPKDAAPEKAPIVIPDIINLQELMKQLKVRVYVSLQNDDIHARDLAAIGNLVLNMAKYEDEVAEKTNSSEGIVAFPALPPAPKVPKHTEAALKRTGA